MAATAAAGHDDDDEADAAMRYTITMTYTIA